MLGRSAWFFGVALARVRLEWAQASARLPPAFLRVFSHGAHAGLTV